MALVTAQTAKRLVSKVARRFSTVLSPALFDHHAGVVDEHVQLAELGFDHRCGGVDVGLLADVELDDFYGETLFAQDTRGDLALERIARAQQHRVAQLAELAAGLEAEAFVGSRDQRYL
jgi:hypothetical protein